MTKFKERIREYGRNGKRITKAPNCDWKIEGKPSLHFKTIFSVKLVLFCSSSWFISSCTCKKQEAVYVYSNDKSKKSGDKTWNCMIFALHTYIVPTRETKPRLPGQKACRIMRECEVNHHQGRWEGRNFEVTSSELRRTGQEADTKRIRTAMHQATSTQVQLDGI